MLENNKVFDYRSAFDYSRITNYGTSLNEERFGKYRSLNGEELLEGALSRALRLTVTFICLTLVILTFPVSCYFCIKRVPSLERIVVFRLGRMLKVKGPGFVVTLPCIDHWMSVDLRPQVYHIPKQQVLTTDGAIVELGSCLHYQVVDVVKSVLQVDGLEGIAKQLADQCLINAATSRDQDDLERNVYKLEIDILNMMNKSTIPWGLEITQVDIGPVTIIKPAEQQNVVETMVKALKSTFTKTDESSPIIPTTATSTTLGINDELRTLVRTVNELLSTNDLQECSGLIKFVLEDQLEDIHLSIRGGQGKAFLSRKDGEEGDVTVRLTIGVLGQLVSGHLSPLQAYAQGLVKATGDLNTLKNLGDVFSSRNC